MNTKARQRPCFLRGLCGLLCISLFGACAVAPHGPIVSHTIETFSRGRSDYLVGREEWKDNAFSRGVYFFADPTLSAVQAWHTNQTALGGCSHFTAGAVTITVDSNLVPAITATGTAVGNVIGATVKSAAK